MRIEAYTQIQQMYKTTAVNKSQKTTATRKSDQLHISSFGKDIQTAKQAVAGSADIREEKVAPLRASVKDGSYNVSADSFADKLLAKYEEMR
ncbi:MAG: flagellar biosynthesis anti-sigma factor FlgM [Lachnospiraceae bacterium]|nr:flagellar biosynthesis anti-sigma factor FlgM [Lachnospiraceae bacterium]